MRPAMNMAMTHEHLCYLSDGVFDLYMYNDCRVALCLQEAGIQENLS